MFAGRAVLLDITSVHQTQVLPAGYEITVDDLEAAQAAGWRRAAPGRR